MEKSMSASTRVFAISACLWLTIGTAEADFVGLNIGPSHLQPALSGPNHSANSDSIDLVDDLDVENPEQSSMMLILEHPISALPNIRYQGYALNSPSTFNSGSTIGGSSSETGSSFELSQNDIVLYYQLLDSKVDLDFGVDLKHFDGEVTLADSNNTSISVDETIPLLYLSARYDLPYDGLYVGANINSNAVNLGLSDSSAQDSAVMLGYNSGNGLGIEGGFKYFSLDLDHVNQQHTELEYDGLYLNGYFNF
jgi:outer membrane protein